MTERTLREKIAKIIRANLSGPAFAETKLQADHERDIQHTAGLIFALLDAHTAQPAPDAVAEAAKKSDSHK